MLLLYFRLLRLFYILAIFVFFKKFIVFVNVFGRLYISSLCLKLCCLYFFCLCIPYHIFGSLHVQYILALYIFFFVSLLSLCVLISHVFSDLFISYVMWSSLFLFVLSVPRYDPALLRLLHPPTLPTCFISPSIHPSIHFYSGSSVVARVHN